MAVSLPLGLCSGPPQVFLVAWGVLCCRHAERNKPDQLALQPWFAGDGTLACHYSLHMARSGARIGVQLPTHITDQVHLIKEHEGTSLSRVVCSAMEQHATTDEWQARVAAASAPRENLLASIADLPLEKQQLILQALEG